MLKEERRRAVEERMTRQFGLADEADQLKIHQRLDVRRYVHTTDLLDLALRERLTVRDNRQRLQRRTAQTVRTVQLEHRAHVAPAARRRLQTVRAARADELEAATGDVQRLLETLQRLFDLTVRAGLVNVHHLGILARFGFNGLDGRTEVSRGQRNLTRKKQGADDFLEAARQRNLDVVTHSLRVSPEACRPAPPSRAGS